MNPQDQDSPALACQAPLLTRAVPGATEWSAALASPPPSTNFPTGSTRLTLDGPSAFSVVPPAAQQTTSLAPVLPTLYPGLMCLPALLERLGAQNILRNPMNSTFKPIPNNDLKVDLARFRVKDPLEWLVDDVVPWIMDVAKRHKIPYEEMNMHEFARLTGKQLMEMNEQQFLQKDPTYGSLIYKDFKKIISEDTLLDDFIKRYPTEEESSSMSALGAPSTSFDLPKPQPTMPSSTLHPTPVQPSPQMHSPLSSQLHSSLQPTLSLKDPLQSSTLNQNLIQGLHTLNAVQQSLSHDLQNAQLQTAQLQQSLTQSLASTLAAGLNSGLSPMSIPLMQNGLSPSSPLLSTSIQPKLSPMPTTSMPSSSLTNNNEMSRYNPGSVSSDYDEDRQHCFEGKIKKNRDGRPRKRSQHTKGNKLWEFIRDALKDPDTCPSVVRWEDPVEGVFRIVESEKLARLWGARKNNTKMTYEKLSRAMRTYYEKQILVPVPKTGLYPKKLVYKFGPGAHGWDKVKEELH